MRLSSENTGDRGSWCFDTIVWQKGNGAHNKREDDSEGRGGGGVGGGLQRGQGEKEVDWEAGGGEGRGGGCEV